MVSQHVWLIHALYILIGAISPRIETIRRLKVLSRIALQETAHFRCDVCVFPHQRTIEARWAAFDCENGQKKQNIFTLCSYGAQLIQCASGEHNGIGAYNKSLLLHESDKPHHLRHSHAFSRVCAFYFHERRSK